MQALWSEHANIRKSRDERSAFRKKREKYSTPVAPRICCVSDKSRSGNSQIAKRTGIRIHVDDDGNVNTYTRNDVATRPVGTHLRGSRYVRRLGIHSTYLRRCGYIFYKTFLIPRRITGETRKGWCAEVTRTRRTPAGRRRGGERENRGGEGGKKREEGEGTRRGRMKGEGKGEPEHFVKQGKMRLRRGTTATFLSLQNYVFRGPPPYLSKHNKFPLCLSRSSSTSSSAFSSSTTPALPCRLFFRRSPRVCNRDTSVLLPCRGHTSASRNALLVYLVLRRRIRLGPRPRGQHPHPHAGPRLSADPSTSIVSLWRTHPDRSQLPKSSIRDPTVSLPWDNPAGMRITLTALDIYFPYYDARIVQN